MRWDRWSPFRARPATGEPIGPTAEWAAQRLDVVVAEIVAVRGDASLPGRKSRLDALELARDDLLLAAARALGVDVGVRVSPLPARCRRLLAQACADAGVPVHPEPVGVGLRLVR